MKSRSTAIVLFVAASQLRIYSVQSADVPSTNAPTVLPTVTVTAPAVTPSLTSPAIESAAEQKQQVPGGFTIRDATEMEKGRASSFLDLLSGIPGLNLQSQNGMEATKISIRGSDVLSDDEPLGLQVLLDGFTFNQGDGEVILEDFDLGGVKYAEVFRGANAFKYGGITLGGAINLVSKTGYDADPLQLRLEGGSYGFLRAQASTGGVEGPADYFASVTGRLRDGFREHSSENTEDLFANFGYRFDEHVENRFYLTLARTDRLVPGAVTKEQMAADPRQADPESVDQSLNKSWYYLRLADKVSFKSDTESADAGVYWWHRDLLERDLFNDDTFDGIQKYYSDNFGILLNSVTRTELFGQRNLLTLGFAPTIEREVDGDYENLAGQVGPQTGGDKELSINAPLYVEDQQYLTEKLSVQAGVQAIYAQRHFTDDFTGTVDGDQSANLVFRTLSPKLGAIYEFNDENQVYANFSRSWQPPSFDNMVDFDDDNPPPAGSLKFTPLVPQHAWTAEVGTRGEAGRFEWELSLYHSWVRDELLDINDAFGVDRGAVNIGRAYHQGIEAGLEIELLDATPAKGKARPSKDRLTLSQTYTLNDFHFDGDPVYGNNRIAGIPIHLYQAELMYEAPCGFYAGPNIQCNLSSYPVDHENTLSADAYALPGFKMGYRSKLGFTIFFEAKNLTDSHYASAVDPIPDATNVGGPIQIFHPGDGRSFYAGISWVLR